MAISAYSERMKTIHSKRHKKLIELVVAERKRALTQVQLAKKLKRSQSWVARLEGGDRRIDVIELLDLAEIIGFDAPAMVAELAKK
jgi:hypothetical protein